MSIVDMMADGAFASACATVISNPFDVVRTRMQLQGEMKKAGEYEVIYKNLFQAAYKIAKDEGALSLQKGLVPAVFLQMVFNGIRIGTYPLVKIEISNVMDNLQERYYAYRQVEVSQRESAPPISETYLFFVRAVAAAMCGLTGMFAASPLNMVKTRLQSEHGVHQRKASGDPSSPSPSSCRGRSESHTAMSSTAAKSTKISSASTVAARPMAPLSTASTGTQFGYTGVMDGLVKIYKKGGVRGLWHGAGIGAQRSMLASPFQLVSYDYCRGGWSAFLEYPISDVRVHVLAAINTSFFVTICMCPLDVVMTRAYNTRIADRESRAAGKNTIQYNIFKQVLAIYRVEGLTGMYKGSIALFARSAPHNITTFVVLEWVRKMRETHLPSRAYTQGSILTRSSKDSGGVEGRERGAFLEEDDIDPEEFILSADLVASISDG